MSRFNSNIKINSAHQLMKTKVAGDSSFSY